MLFTCTSDRHSVATVSPQSHVTDLVLVSNALSTLVKVEQTYAWQKLFMVQLHHEIRRSHFLPLQEVIAHFKLEIGSSSFIANVFKQ